MKNGKYLFRILTLVLATMLTGLTGCTIVAGDGGPPSHAPAWGHRSHAYFEYYYYPHAHVYYDIRAGYYFYLSGSRWHRVRTLPGHIHIDRRDRVRLKNRNKKPYLKNREHREKYGSRRKHKYDKKHDRREREYNRKEHGSYKGKNKKHRNDDDGRSSRGKKDKENRGRGKKDEEDRDRGRGRDKH